MIKLYTKEMISMYTRLVHAPEIQVGLVCVVFQEFSKFRHLLFAGTMHAVCRQKVDNQGGEAHLRWVAPTFSGLLLPSVGCSCPFGGLLLPL